MATPVTYQAGATVTRGAVDYRDWLMLNTKLGAQLAEFPIDVTITCPH